MSFHVDGEVGLGSRLKFALGTMIRFKVEMGDPVRDKGANLDRGKVTARQRTGVGRSFKVGLHVQEILPIPFTIVATLRAAIGHVVGVNNGEVTF